RRSQNHAMTRSPHLSMPPPTPELHTLSLHDALPISGDREGSRRPLPAARAGPGRRSWGSAARGRHPTGTAAATGRPPASGRASRSEEHTSELQSQSNLVCRLLLEKKKKTILALDCHL